MRFTKSEGTDCCVGKKVSLSSRKKDGKKEKKINLKKKEGDENRFHASELH